MTGGGTPMPAMGWLAAAGGGGAISGPTLASCGGGTLIAVGGGNKSGATVTVGYARCGIFVCVSGVC